MVTKPKIIKDYQNIDDLIKERLREVYPMGFGRHLIKFQNREGKWINALPYETDDKSYLIKMTGMVAHGIPVDKKKEVEEDFDSILAENDGANNFNLEEE